MKESDNNVSMRATNTKLETRLSEGGRYYRTFLHPAIAEGISALDSDERLHLFQLFFDEEPYREDDRFLSERLACSIPEVRTMRQRAVDALHAAVHDHTGLHLTKKQLIGVLLAAGESERIGRSYDIAGALVPHDDTSSAAATVLVQIIVTAGFLSARMATRLNARPYRVNWIEIPSLRETGEGRGQQHVSTEKRAPERIAIKTVPAIQGSASMLVEATRRLYLEVSLQDQPIATPHLCIAWPGQTKECVIPMHRGESAQDSHRVRALIGYLDAHDRFVLQLEENDVRLEDVHAPIAFSCLAAAAERV